MANKEVSRVGIDSIRMKLEIARAGYSINKLASNPNIHRSSRTIRENLKYGVMSPTLLWEICDLLKIDVECIVVKEGQVERRYPEAQLPTNVVMHKDICFGLSKLYERKNHDYGDSFHKTFMEEGFAMARIRLSDKLERFKSLTKNDAKAMVNDESVEDTLLDMANYAIMTVIEMRRRELEETMEEV